MCHAWSTHTHTHREHSHMQKSSKKLWSPTAKSLSINCSSGHVTIICCRNCRWQTTKITPNRCSLIVQVYWYYYYDYYHMDMSSYGIVICGRKLDNGICFIIIAANLWKLGCKWPFAVHSSLHPFDERRTVPEVLVSKAHTCTCRMAKYQIFIHIMMLWKSEKGQRETR